MFITLILYREEDKENKIKLNKKNIVNYLKVKGLWNKTIYKNEKFDENLNDLKIINIQINQILEIVDIKEEDIYEVQEYIKIKEKANKPPEPFDIDIESESGEENDEIESSDNSKD